MQTLRMSPPRQTAHSDSTRTSVHDLRNLFAVVASAKFLLERPIDERRKGLVIDALGRLAIEGKIIADGLLSRDRCDRAPATDAMKEMRAVAPLLTALERPGVTIETFISKEAAYILMSPSELTAVVLEMVTNAMRADASTIRIRSVRRGDRYWLIAGDDGCGFEPDGQSSYSSQPGLHGTGLRRLASAAAAARGKITVKSAPRRGTVVAMMLPLMRR